MPFSLEYKSSLIKTSQFYIDEQRVSYNDIQFPTSDADGFAYGNTGKENRYSNVTFHHIKIRSKHGQKIEFRYADSILKDTQATMNNMVAALWKYFGNRIMNEIIHAISSGRQIEIAGMTVDKNGLQIKHKPWFRAERIYQVPWQDIEYKMNTDWEWLEFKSKTDKKVKGIVGLIGVFNGHVFAAILGEIKTNAEMINYLTGKKIYPLNQ